MYLSSLQTAERPIPGVGGKWAGGGAPPRHSPPDPRPRTSELPLRDPWGKRKLNFLYLLANTRNGMSFTFIIIVVKSKGCPKHVVMVIFILISG